MHLQRRPKGGNRFSNPSYIGDGGFWAPQDVFEEFIDGTGSQPEEQVSAHCAFFLPVANFPFITTKTATCNTRAGDPKRTPSTAAKLETSGVFAVNCRHVIFVPNGIVDLVKGER